MLSATQANAQKLVDSQNKSPDFSYEFNGKDSCEKFNRAMFKFNSKLNKYVIRPVNIVWSSIIPKYGIERLDNAFNNIGYPKRLMGSLLQGDFKASGSETLRFITNSTLGLGGLYDPAQKWFKIAPKQEDMGQVLAKYGVKKGPYLYLPFAGSTNLRDCLGKILEVPLSPSIYLGGPVISIANGAKVINKTSSVQDVIKIAEKAYIDPYELSKQLYGFDRYKKINNLDRLDVFNQKVAQLKEEKTGSARNIASLTSKFKNIDADILLPEFNSQSSTIDSFRSTLFDAGWKEKSAWLELSVWNRTFNKKLKTASIKLKEKAPKYEYRYILQKKKDAPLAILYPTIGSDVYAKKSIVLAKLLYEKGYSVLITGSNFHWGFIKNMPDGYIPGYLPRDAKCLREVTSKVLAHLEKKKKRQFNNKIVVGTSWGAMNSLFMAAQEDKDNTLGINKYISINPPIDVVYAIKQVDKFIVDWKKHDSDIKLKSALTIGKAIQMAKQNRKNEHVKLSLNEDEAQLLVATTMKQKLSDLVIALEESNMPKEDIYQKIRNMDFFDYMKEYVLSNSLDSLDNLRYHTSLYSLSDFIKRSDKIKIYHAMDDYFVSDGQLDWLKKQGGEKVVLFSNGSHLGYLYRQEFKDCFDKDIAPKAISETNL